MPLILHQNMGKYLYFYFKLKQNFYCLYVCMCVYTYAYTYFIILCYNQYFQYMYQLLPQLCWIRELCYNV